MASANNPPPKVSDCVTVFENRNLPKTSVPWNENHLPIDIVLLTVEDCEFLSCLSFLNDGFYKSHHPDLGYVYFGWIGETTKLKIAVVKCNKGSTVPGGSVIVVKNAAEVLRPKAVFNVGFCGCLNERKAKLGDVVVSARLITYGPAEVTASGIKERGICVPLEKHLENLVKSCGDGWEPPLEDQAALEVEVHRDGVLLSGPEEVAKKERRDELTARFPEAIAIEMEGQGLYTAAHDLGIEWIVVKGVSDFADEKKSKKDSWRLFASIMAASLTAHILSDPIVFRNLPHYGAKYVQQRPDFQPPTPRPLAGPSSAGPIGGVKAGQPTDDDLEELSEEIADKWGKLALRLGFDRAKVTAYHKDYEKLFDKAYNMLMDWKQREGSTATYQVLYDALCHRLVGCKGLAEKFCKY